jgi:hypothetical protein
MLLKNYEHRYLTYFKQRQQADLEIAAPTAISYYHMLDESFHTTTSQLISQDLYKEFNQPTLYEQLMANFMFYRGQEVLLSGLSGVLPATFRNDGTFLQPLYQILRSPIFGLDHQEALQRLAEGVCQEHDGYHMNLKHHRSPVLPAHALSVGRQPQPQADGERRVDRAQSAQQSASFRNIPRRHATACSLITRLGLPLCLILE